MSPALKELSKMSYQVIKNKLLPKENWLSIANFSGEDQSQEYFENRVSF
jgi:hypothetical protein